MSFSHAQSPGGHESGVQVPTGVKKKGAFGVRFRWKKGVIQYGLKKKNGFFFDVDPKNGGHLVCKYVISSQNLQSLCYNTVKFVNFWNARESL